MKLLSGEWIGKIRRLLMVRGMHRWNAWVRDVTAMLGVLACVVFLSGCDLLDLPVPPIETFSTGELVEELASRIGLSELEGLFGDDD